MKFYYITFRSVTYAQRGERILSDAGFHCNLLRTPKWMENKGCGYALRIWTMEIERAVKLLQRGNVLMRRLYIQNGDGQLEEIQL